MPYLHLLIFFESISICIYICTQKSPNIHLCPLHAQAPPLERVDEHSANRPRVPRERRPLLFRGGHIWRKSVRLAAANPPLQRTHGADLRRAQHSPVRAHRPAQPLQPPVRPTGVQGGGRVAAGEAGLHCRSGRLARRSRPSARLGQVVAAVADLLLFCRCSGRHLWRSHSQQIHQESQVRQLNVQ